MGEFLRAGARVHVLDVNESAIDDLESQYKESGAFSATATDLGSPELCARSLESLSAPVYGLVHLAGVFESDDLDPSYRAVWDRALATNLTTAFDMVTACAARFDLAVGGRVILTSSIAYRRGSFDHLAYSASKGGIAALVRALSKRLAPRVLVNGVAPGIINTSMPRSIIKDRGERLQSEIPLGRWGEPEEVARVIRFLCTDDSSYMTGQMLNVDGGIVNS
ncbi:MAG: SDR family oxidoreductase [Burkholderiales bacterium]|nr:SDR family oxidoreductase [Burkholderiales bacterium]